MSPRQVDTCALYLRPNCARDLSLREHFPSLKLRCCSTLVDAVAAIDDSRTASFVMEVGPYSFASLPHVVARLRQRVPTIPCLLQCDMPLSAICSVILERPWTVEQVVLSAGWAVDLVDALERFCQVRGTATPHLQIASRVMSAVPSAVIDIAVAAVFVGERRSTIGDLARACHLSTRTIEQRLSAAGLPSPKRLLLANLYLHTLWGVRCLGFSSKQAAALSDYQSPQELGAVLRRSHHRSVLRLMRHFNFSSELDAFVQSLGRRI